MARYVALLRGVNVGGSKVIRMSDLKACFEEQGMREVATFIASGNVLFSAAGGDRDRLTKRLEKALTGAFAHTIAVFLRSGPEMRGTVESAPAGFGREPARYRYDVAFVRAPLTAKEVMKSVSLREGVDRAWAGKGVLYFSRLAARASQSRLSRLASMPVYASLTLRNWNTTTKLADLLDG